MREKGPPPSPFLPAKLLTCGQVSSPKAKRLKGNTSSLEALCKAEGGLSMENGELLFTSKLPDFQLPNGVLPAFLPMPAWLCTVEVTRY